MDRYRYMSQVIPMPYTLSRLNGLLLTKSGPVCLFMVFLMHMPPPESIKALGRING